MTKDEIVNLLQANKKEIMEQFQVSKIGLFGSYSTNTQTDKSDVDILVSMPSDFDLYYNLKKYLEEMFNTRVDLGIEKNLRELIKNNITDEVLYV